MAPPAGVVVGLPADAAPDAVGEDAQCPGSRHRPVASDNLGGTEAQANEAAGVVKVADWSRIVEGVDAGGRSRLQLIVGAEMAPAVNAWLEGDLDAAGAELLGAFFTAYWGDPEPAEIGQIVRVELRE